MQRCGFKLGTSNLKLAALALKPRDLTTGPATFSSKMAKYIDSSLGLKISDLMNEDGFTFDIEEQDFDDEDEFGYSSNVHFTNQEMINMLNMNNDDGEENEEGGCETLNGLNFENLRQKMSPVTLDQKVMKYVKQKGMGESVHNANNPQITFHYVAYYEHGDTPFDSTYAAGRPRSLRLNEVLPGLALGLQTMLKDEIAAFLIHPDLAYMALGCVPTVPPNSVVLFVVHLLSFLDDGSADTLENLSKEEKQSFKYMKKTVEQKLGAAKNYVTKRNIKQAIREYRSSIDILESIKLKDADEEQEMYQLLVKSCTNLAICYNKEETMAPRSACIACLRIPENMRTSKTYYNLGKALLTLGEYKSAMTELQKALKIDPENEEIKKIIKLTNKKQIEYSNIEKRLWRNSFRSKTDETTEKTSEFRKAARALCESINDKDVMRQLLPTEGFTEEEHQILRDEAAKLGLNILQSIRYGEETVYIQKGKS